MLGLTFHQLKYDTFADDQPKNTRKPSFTKPLWKIPKKRELLLSQTLCEICHKFVPCPHAENGNFEINTVTGEVRKRIIRSKPLKKAKLRAAKRKKNREKHSKQKTHKPTLREVREYELSHPTPAGNRFSELCQEWFPNRKALREEIKGYYVLDFYFPAINLGVEIDGGIHNRKEVKEHDEKRTDYLHRVHGVRIVRFTNSQVFKESEHVYEVLAELLTDKQRKRSDSGNHDSPEACAPADLGELATSTPVLDSLGV
jgi:very-short-patch-repair endonuclease